MNRNNYKFGVLTSAAYITVCVLFFATSQAQEILTGQTMGTIKYSVKIERLPESLTRANAQTIVDRELDHVNRRMSTYRDDSDVCLFNQHKSTDWFPVSNETCVVVARALECSELSAGAFDVTVAPLVNLWNFGPLPRDRMVLPTPEQIASARSHVGYQRLHVQLAPPSLKKDDPELWVDLSAIAKGYAVDQVAQALTDAGVHSFMVEVGGEVVVRGKKANGDVWNIGITWPHDGLEAYRDVAALDNKALATSGDYRNFTLVAGKRYSHTIDPATGSPVMNDLASVSIIAPDCMTADAMATTVMVLGAEAGQQLCAKMRLPLMTYRREGDTFTMWRSDDFPLVTVANSPPPQGTNWRTFVATMLIFGLVIVAMAIGVIFGNRRIAGSCGGLGNLRDEQGNIACSLCTHPQKECRDPERWAAPDDGNASSKP